MVVSQQMWNEAMDSLGKLPEYKRDQFGLLLVNLAKCYMEGSKSHALVLVNVSDEAMLTFAINADEMEAADLVNRAQEVLNTIVTEDAPDRAMFN